MILELMIEERVEIAKCITEQKAIICEKVYQLEDMNITEMIQYLERYASLDKIIDKLELENMKFKYVIEDFREEL